MHLGCPTFTKVVIYIFLDHLVVFDLLLPVSSLEHYSLIMSFVQIMGDNLKWRLPVQGHSHWIWGTCCMRPIASKTGTGGTSCWAGSRSTAAAMALLTTLAALHCLASSLSEVAAMHASTSYRADPISSVLFHPDLILFKVLSHVVFASSPCCAGGKLHQEPAPELSKLRIASHSWTEPSPFKVLPEQPFPISAVHGASLEVSLTLLPTLDATAASVLLHSESEANAYGGGEDGPSDCCGVAITVSWAEATLKVP